MDTFVPVDFNIPNAKDCCLADAACRLHPLGEGERIASPVHAFAIGGWVGKASTDDFARPAEDDMRDFRDGKAMAQSLRQALAARSIRITHSDSLELIASAFGLKNWNVLAAKISPDPPPDQATGEDERAERAARMGPKELYCSFCGAWHKQVRRLIAGPHASICDRCIAIVSEVPKTDPEPVEPSR